MFPEHSLAAYFVNVSPFDDLSRYLDPISLFSTSQFHVL